MKDARQSIIIDIIRSQRVENQQQLQEALAARGILTTQSTLSRDIRTLRLTKSPDSDGRFCYVLPGRQETDDTHNKLKTILKESLLSVDTAQNIIVIRTMPGLASAACSAFDSMKIPNLVGTLAGDDTAFLAMRDAKSAIDFSQELHSIL